MGDDSGSIEERPVKFACIALTFRLWRIEWRDRHLCHVTGSDHTFAGVYLRWEGNLLIISMYVCKSENLHPARLKQKSHSCAEISNKQKRLQCPSSRDRAAATVLSNSVWI